VEIGVRSHIAANCTVAGGKAFQFRLGDFSSLSSGVRVYCSSNDYVNDLVMIAPESMPELASAIAGDVLVGNYTGIGANSVVMPDNMIPEGTVIGALSFVPAHFEFKPWSVYVGSPIRYVKARNRASVMEQVERIRAQT
jgi:acetyltransferase-like isoleucine patch superfamily enzyme